MPGGKTILQLIYDLNSINIEQNNIEMKLIRDPENTVLLQALEVLNERHDAIIYELCGRIPSLEGDKNLIPIKKRRLIKDEKDES